ncbi:hypothetical protein D9756_003848 [Leucocoprinus leucothites]|uniref:Prephenate dehydratase domain-containing protein n=1 Tax=Leucocoprinus leucothites TaxID=201217 RepID=A0A8H5G068_9AGAR|nr:hypothetical protein D9756_003848 [Leucoagaricus leucothites]
MSVLLNGTQAAHKIFGDAVEYEERRTISGMVTSGHLLKHRLTRSSDTLRAVQETVQIGVVPQENTIFGNVIETYDGLRRSQCGFVKGEITLQIQHCLLAKRGVRLQEIETVLSHEQALGQCQDFLDANLPNASRVKTPSTASAARALLAGSRTCAAICSKVCATIFDELEIIREGIQKEADNFTRFYIIVRDREVEFPTAAPHTANCRALIRLWISPPPPSGTRPHKDVIHYLASSGLGITRIDRRPSDDDLPFRDVYFVEVAGTAEVMGRSEQSPAIRSWPMSVADALGFIRNMGGEVDLIGLW